jgi:long-chain acyl-CoA synthetase
MNNTILPRRPGTSIVLRPRFDLEEFWHVVERLRPTYFTAVPTVFARLTDAWDGRADTSSPRFVRSGAAPMAPSLQRLVEERLGVPAVLSYGLSEATCTCTMNPPDASRRDQSPYWPDASFRIMAVVPCEADAGSFFCPAHTMFRTSPIWLARYWRATGERFFR